MRTYLIRRLLLGVLVFLGLTLVTFFIARVVPSDPAARWVGPRATVEQIARARAKLGLDKPIHVQYGRYMADLVQGDWGTSIVTHQPVLRDIKTYLPASLELTISGMILAVIVGIPLGVISAAHKDRAVDHLSRAFSIGAVSLPTFWVAMVLQLVFFGYLRLLPVGGELDLAIKLAYPVHQITGSYLVDSLITGNWVVFANALLHLILPAVTLAAYPLGLITRMTRSSMLEVLNEDYIRVARAYGMTERRITYLYALKNAIGPTVTVIALTVAYSLAGTFLIEAVFNWPGLGHYAADAVLAADYPAIMGVTILVAIFYVALNLAVDVVQAILDPRIKAA